jgi:oligopeptide transport system substrate-binding protein
MTYPVVGAEAYHSAITDDFSTVGFRAIDNRTVEIRLREPVPYFLSLLAEYPWLPVPIHVIEEHGGLSRKGSAWTRPDNMVSNGAFVLKEWVQNQVVAVERNPEYWDAESVGLNEIHFHPIESQETEERAFRARQLHATSSLPVSKIAVYQRDNPESLRMEPRLGVAYVMCNTRIPPLDRPEIRRALALAVNRDLLVERVLQGGQRPALTFSQPGMGGFTSEIHLTGDPSDIPALLADAGYPDGSGFPAIDYLYNTSDGNRKIAEALQEMWRKNLGTDIGLTNQEWKVFLDNRTMGEYGLARAGWLPFADDPIDYYQLLTTAAPDNSTGWFNPEYEECFRRARATVDPEERMRLYQCMESIILRDLPIIPLFHYSTVYLVHPSVQGWTMNRLDTRPWKQIRLEEN